MVNDWNRADTDLAAVIASGVPDPAKQTAFDNINARCLAADQACNDFHSQIALCVNKTNSARTNCTDPDQLQRNFEGEIARLKTEFQGQDSSYQCSKNLLQSFKTKSNTFANSSVQACRNDVNACKNSCNQAIASANRCPSASGDPDFAAFQTARTSCTASQASPDRMDTQARRFQAVLDRQIQQLGTGSGATSDNADLGVACVGKNDPDPAPSPDPAPKTADKKDATKKSSTGGDLSSMMGALAPMLGAMMNQQAAAVPTAVTPATTNMEDCSLAQNANNVTCICASNPRSAGCQLALNGQNGNPVTFGATGGTGGANLTKDESSTASSADFAAQQMQMPAIDRNAVASASSGSSGYVGSGGSTIGGGLGGANNASDDHGGNRRGTSLSAQILGTTSGASGSFGSRSAGMAFIDRDSTTNSYRRGSSWDKIDVAQAAASQPNLREFAPTMGSPTATNAALADRRIAGVEEGPILHPANKILFNEMHNRYLLLANTLDDSP